MGLKELEYHTHQLLDIEIYSAEEILKAEGCDASNKNMSVAYMLAINRAKQIVSLCIDHYKEKNE